MIYLLEHDNKPINHEHVNFLLNKSLKKKVNKIIVSITGCNISSNQSFKLNICYKHIDELENYISIIKDGLIKRSSKYISFVELAMQIPGIQCISAIWMIGEIGTDMGIFQDAKHFSS